MDGYHHRTSDSGDWMSVPAVSGSARIAIKGIATVPNAPTGLTAEAGDGSVTLRWTASAYDGGSAVTSHQYRRKTTGAFGGWQDIPESAPPDGANATSYTVAFLTNGTAYVFEVQARNQEGDSGPSNEASATPMDTTAPMLLSATTTALALALIYDEDPRRRLGAGAVGVHGHCPGTAPRGDRGFGEQYEGAPDPRPGGSGRGDGDGVVHRAREQPPPGRGEQPRRRLFRPPGDERGAGDGARRPDGPRGDPRRRFGDPAVDGVRP